MFLKYLLLILLFSISLFAKGEIRKIYAHYEDATPSQYTKNGHTYKWGQGKNIVIDGFEYNGHKYNYTGAYGNVIVKVRRSDNSNASGKPCELFAVKHNDNNYQYTSTFPQKDGKCDMATVMGGRIISVGALDLFRNTGYSAKNIERVDFITPNGITAPTNSADLAKAGHVVTEKSGNNPIKIAAILSLDANGDPSSYGPLVGIHTGEQIDYGLTTIYFPDDSTSYSRNQAFLIDNKHSSQGYPYYYGTYKEALGMAFVSLQDLGISAGQKYYGFSYFGRDVTNSMNLVNYNSFPKTTNGDTADPYGGVEGYFVDESLPVTTTNAICYALDDTKSNLYKVEMKPGANPLPVATKINLRGLNGTSLNGEGEAFNSADGLIYGFHQDDHTSNPVILYSINPTNGEVKKVTQYNNMKTDVTGAAFYNGYFYVIAKHPGANTLYKIDTSNWSIISQKDFYGDTSKGDALAINKNGQAYIIRDGQHELYKFDLNSAKTTYLFKIDNTNTDAEALSFAKDGNLYTENSEENIPNDTDQLFKIDLSNGHLTPAAQIPHLDDIDIEGLSCNTEAGGTSSTPPPSANANAMLLTRGDGNNNDKTNIYVFYVDTDTDTIKDFHLLKKLNKKFRSLSYHDGKFWTADMSGNLYTIDINTGNYTKDTTYGKIDNNAIMSLDFDENNNIYYNIWSSNNSEKRKLRKYNPSTHSSTITATIPSSDSYIDDGIAYYGNNKFVVSVGSGAVRFIQNGTSGEHISSSEWCVYGGEYVGNDKSYFINAESNDLSIYKLDGTNWSKFFNYGAKTGGLKGMAIAVVHDSSTSQPPVCETGPNLVKNPSFEDSDYKNHWNGDIWKGTSYHVPDGSNYAYVDNDHGGVGYQDIPIESGKKYKLTFDAAMSTSFKGQYVSIEYLCPAHKPKNIISKTDITNNIQPSHDFKTYTLNLPEATGDSSYIRVKFDTKNGDFLKVDNFDLRVNCSNEQRGFDITDAQLGEEEASRGQQMKFKIATNIPAPAGGIDIQYKISNKTAQAGSDFIANTTTTYTAHIPEGAKEVNIFVPIIDDNQLEDAEYFTVQLQPYTGAIIPDPIAIGIIIDNDMEPIPPTQDGKYTVNDYGMSGDILRTKIAGSNSKITIKAISGFSVLHDRQKHTAQNCSTSCSCGPCHEKTCSTTCSTYVYYTDITSNKMNIDEVILHYQDGSTVLLSGAHSMNSGDSFNLNLPTNKATRKAWITVKGHSDTLYKTGKSIELTATSDPFAIRPDRFEIELSGFNKTNPLIADKNINMKIKAVKIDGSKVTQYSGSNFTQTLIDAKYGDSISHGLDLSSYSFSSGEISKTTKYDEVGDLTIKVEEKAPYFAQIDAFDKCDYKIGSATYNVTVIPDKFLISYNVNDFNNINSITFFADSLNTNMFSTVSYKIEAKSNTNNTLKRYDGSNGYAKNSNITITHSINSDPKTMGNNLTIKYKDSKINTYKTFLASSGTTLNLTLNNTDFNNGIASDTIIENFTRDRKTAKNPLILNIDKIDVKESNGIAGHLVSGSLSSTKSAHFYYARAHAPSPQTADKDTLDAKLYYEVYCKNCNKSIFPLAQGRASIDSVYWYILPQSVRTNFSGVCNYKNNLSVANTGANAVYNNSQTITVKASHIPHKNRVFYTPAQKYLQYNRFGTYLPKHYFDVVFTSKAPDWAGEGEIGKTVDTNISKIQNQSLEW